MSKKYRSSKLLLSTILATSAFVSTIHVDAAEQSTAEKWVKEAENLTGALKWAISVEGKENSIPEIPWNLYNQTKQAHKKAHEAIKNLSAKEKVILEARLQENVELYISTTPGKVGRVVAYIDAVTAGKKIEEKKAALEKKVKNNEIDDAMEKAYHELSWELKKQSILLDRVYGQSTRNAIRDHFKKSAENVKAEALYPVSIKIELDRANAAIAKGNLEEANKRLKAADEFLKVALEKGFVGKESAMFTRLTEKIIFADNQYKAEVSKGSQTPSNDNYYSGGGGSPTIPPIQDAEYSNAGTYGPASGVQVINGNVKISSKDVVLRNVVIKGDLLISEEVAEGDVRLKNVKVQGQTLVKGGGENSIYFEDSVLATVIVNKNNGAIRIVATGRTHVVEVQLESYVKIEERNLSQGSDGFTNISVSETLQSDNQSLNVQLIGSFETINSRATGVRIELDGQTDIRTLILNAAASVLGTGRITTAEINAAGSTLSTRPQNIVLENGTSTSINGVPITESTSSVHQTSITSANATPASLSLGFQDFVAGITLDDLKVTAKINGQLVTLEGLAYNHSHKKLTYVVPNFVANLGKTLEITVAPAVGTTKLSGNAISTSTQIKNGFSGRITDVAGVGVSGAKIKFRNGFDNREGAVATEVVTDQYGYYVAYVQPGQYTGEISGNHLVTTYMYASALSDHFNNDQNDTAIRAAATSELKIMLSWGEHPWDLDSHLVGPSSDGEDFHTYYWNKIHTVNGINFVDLDWDDVVSYGPETTTLRKLTDGRYIFYVHHYSGQNTIRTSNAKIQVFKGNEQTASNTFTAPTGDGTEPYWVVFAMDISNNGQDVDVLPLNIMEEADIFDLRQSEQHQWYLQPQQSLQAMIVASEQLVEGAVEGTEEGQYLVGSIAVFNAAIEEAKNVNTSAPLKELIMGIKKLYDAKVEFEESIMESIEPETILSGPILFNDLDQDGTYTTDDTLQISFTEEYNFDLFLDNQEILIELIDSTSSDTINIYRNITEGDIDITNPRNFELILSINTEEDLTDENLLILGHSAKGMNFNSFIITFKELLLSRFQ